MTGKVIQGFFLGGQPKLVAVQPRIAAPPSIQAKIAAPAPATAFTGRPPGPPIPAFGARPSGPPAPAFAPRTTAVQRHGAGNAFAVDSGALGLLSGGGRPLPDAVRGKMEAALGANFADVRVHVGPQAERIGAIAFTVGSDIYFAPGRYLPDTVHGQQLLGHELTHVVQQRAGRVRNPLGSGLAVVQDHALEAEADRLGQRAAMHRVTAQAKMPSGAAQPSAPVRISPPINAGPGSYRLTAGASGRQVGSVMVHARDKGAVEVTDLHVAEAQRGHGIGKMLLASAARTGQQFGRSKLTLAAEDNGSGHLTSWYRGIGFAQTGVNQRGYPQLEAPISRVLRGAAQPKLTGFQAQPRRLSAQFSGYSSTLQRAGRTLSDEDLKGFFGVVEDSDIDGMFPSADAERFRELHEAHKKTKALQEKWDAALKSVDKRSKLATWQYNGEQYHLNTDHVTKESIPKHHYYFNGTGQDITSRRPTAKEVGKGTKTKHPFSDLPQDLQDFIKTNFAKLLS